MASFSQSRSPIFLFFSIGMGMVALHCGGAAGSTVLFDDTDSGAGSDDGGTTAEGGRTTGSGGGTKNDAGSVVGNNVEGGSNPVKGSCEKTSDCTGGNVCCWELVDAVIASSCHADCGGNGGRRAQACKQQSECQSGTCEVRACSIGGSIESCGPLSNVCP